MKNIISISLLISMTTMTGCAQKKVSNAHYDSRVLDNTFASYQTYPGNKAFAMATDSSGMYVIGYSYDASSIESAKERAIRECNAAKNQAEYTVHGQCKIYAINNRKF